MAAKLVEVGDRILVSLLGLFWLCFFLGDQRVSMPERRSDKKSNPKDPELETVCQVLKRNGALRNQVGR
jgi:hypothetical protein